MSICINDYLRNLVLQKKFQNHQLKKKKINQKILNKLKIKSKMIKKMFQRKNKLLILLNQNKRKNLKEKLLIQNINNYLIHKK
jgi:hypothetical protein